MPQPAVGDVPDAEAEHGVGEHELRHRCETRLSLLVVLSKLHHVENLVNATLKHEKKWRILASLRDEDGKYL